MHVLEFASSPTTFNNSGSAGFLALQFSTSSVGRVSCQTASRVSATVPSRSLRLIAIRCSILMEYVLVYMTVVSLNFSSELTRLVHYVPALLSEELAAALSQI
eukprot:scpid96944/ scgid7202/ 